MKIKYSGVGESSWGGDVVDTNYYCPKCGEQEIFEEVGEGDYYEGSNLYCNNCNYLFTMPTRRIDANFIWID